LIVISLSSTYMRQEPVLERLAAAAAGLPAHTVVSLSGCVSRAAVRIPAGVEVRDWLNLATVLPHTDLLVSHGGQATASAALTHGVPLLLHPFGRDQSEVAAHIARDGSGLVVDQQTSDTDLRESMRLLLRESQFRAVAADHARRLRGLGNGRLAVEALERLLPDDQNA
jgi:UDP:flavonoid glycosyltransferase YjiC (YdhE family)